MDEPVHAGSAAPEPLSLLLTGAFFVCVSLALVPLALIVTRRMLAQRGAAQPVGWGLREVAVLALALFPLQYGAALFASGAGGPGGSASPAGPASPAGVGEHAPAAQADPLRSLAASAIMLFAAAVLAFVLARARGPRARVDLGLQAAGGGPQLLAGLVLYVAAAPGILGVGALWRCVLLGLGYEDLVQPIVRIMAEAPVAQRGVLLGLGVFLVPCLEEFLFRGFVQPALTRRAGVVAGIAVTSLLFGLLHGVAAVVPVAALSLLLGLLRQRSGSLLAPVFVHALHNGTMFLFMWTVPETLEGLGS